nr:uncharacterized protein LOC109150505 [Ipomoea batatas]
MEQKTSQSDSENSEATKFSSGQLFLSQRSNFDLIGFNTAVRWLNELTKKKQAQVALAEQGFLCSRDVHIKKASNTDTPRDLLRMVIKCWSFNYSRNSQMSSGIILVTGASGPFHEVNILCTQILNKKDFEILRRIGRLSKDGLSKKTLKRCGCWAYSGLLYVIRQKQ